MAASFKTNPVSLDELLKDCESGKIQLPDFQRSWVWDEERIKGLIASISQAFPVGALMTLETGGDVNFAPRLIQGAPKENAATAPVALLLDGQQRMTSLYQTTRRNAVVETTTARNAKVKRWYYINMAAALDPDMPREEAIVGMPEDRILRANFGKDVILDLSNDDAEYEHQMFPVNQVFNWFDWGMAYLARWNGDPEKTSLFNRFRNEVLENFQSYQVPVITLTKDTSREAVCLVFEKVNTGGKALDAFELVTAMYAAERFNLREDWAAREARLKKHRVLENISSTEFMQAISLLHTLAARQAAEAAGKQGRDLPAVSATRQSLLKLPLEAYTAWADKVEKGFERAAKFLRLLKIYRAYDVPYQSQITPLAAILVALDQQWENDPVRERLARWYWNGVFGELYGSATESRLARDMLEVPAWISGGADPSTISQATFDAHRLNTLRTRLSAAYKGVSALLMKAGANDFRSGQDYDQAVFFDESVDIHHIFPKAWCEKAGYKPEDYDSIINKTPLGARTNRILGGVAPSAYLARLEKGADQGPPMPAERLDDHLQSHLIDPELLRSDDFTGFLKARREALLTLIERATGKTVYRGEGENEAEDYSHEVEPAQDDQPIVEASQDSEIEDGLTGHRAALAEARRPFWDRYVARHPEAAGDHRKGGGTALWRLVPRGPLIVSQWIGTQGVGLFVRAQTDEPVDDLIAADTDRLRSVLGAEAGTPGSAFGKRLDIDISDPANWDAAGDWLAAETARYVSALSAISVETA